MLTLTPDQGTTHRTGRPEGRPVGCVSQTSLASAREALLDVAGLCEAEARSSGALVVLDGG